jgi:cell division protein FtsB
MDTKALIEFLNKISPLISVPLLLGYGAVIIYFMKEIVKLKDEKLNLVENVNKLKDEQIRYLERQIAEHKQREIDPKGILAEVEIIRNAVKEKMALARKQLDEKLQKLESKETKVEEFAKVVREKAEEIDDLTRKFLACSEDIAKFLKDYLRHLESKTEGEPQWPGFTILFKHIEEYCLFTTQSPSIPFNENLHKILPIEGGVYRVFEISSDWKESIYVGKTGNLRERIYTDLFMGAPEVHTLKRKLIQNAGFPNKEAVKEYLKNKCRIQYLEIPDESERNLFEHFTISILRPRFND